MSKGSKQPLICREQPGRRALTSHGVALAAGMGDVNGGGHADIWERLRDARLSRDTWRGWSGGVVREAAAVGHAQTHSPVPYDGTEPLCQCLRNQSANQTQKLGADHIPPLDCLPARFSMLINPSSMLELRLRGREPWSGVLAWLLLNIDLRNTTNLEPNLSIRSQGTTGTNTLT